MGQYRQLKRLGFCSKGQSEAGVREYLLTGAGVVVTVTVLVVVTVRVLVVVTVVVPVSVNVVVTVGMKLMVTVGVVVL